MPIRKTGLAYLPCDFRVRFRCPILAEAIFAAHAIAKATRPISKLNFFAIERRVSSRLKPLDPGFGEQAFHGPALAVSGQRVMGRAVTDYNQQFLALDMS